MAQRILMIVTSNASMGRGGKPTGIWAEELALPYYTFLDAGFAVDIASPLGGAVPFDPNSIKEQGQNTADTARFLADPGAQHQVSHTAAAAQAVVERYDALFFPGGHGTMWDLPHDAGVTRCVEQAYALGKIIAAVCHGPAGLVTARRPDGKSILFERRVNGFTDDEEAAAGLSDVVPFKLETRMRALGGKFEQVANWQPFAVRDGQLITGQNPASSALVARHVVAALNGASTAPAV